MRKNKWCENSTKLFKHFFISITSILIAFAISLYSSVNVFAAEPSAGIDPLTYLSECLVYHGDEEDPSAFSLRAYTEDGQSIVTPVKDQSPWQTCWGFSAIAASESSILSECYAKWDQLAPGLREKYGIETFAQLCEWLDLSEKQLAWFAFVPEPEGGNYPSQAGEGLYANQEGMGGIYNALGGNYYATSVFARGTGPVEESRVPYQNNEGELNSGIKIIANDGTEYFNPDYLDVMTTTDTLEYDCLIPNGMTKEDIVDMFDDPDRQEMVRQRLEEGVKTGFQTTNLYEDDNGKHYKVVRINELAALTPGYPEILIYEDEDGNRYVFDPDTMTIPGLPPLHIAYYDWSIDESLHYASIFELESSDILPEYRGDDVINEDTIKAIKEELRAGKGVSVAFCADTAAPGNTASAKYINTANNEWAHYTYDPKAAANHGVTIVGYNDNFPKTLFLEGHEPPKDGAWLVKNSWGGGKSAGVNFGNWGIDENDDGIGDGYFWISYWDNSIQAIETFNYKVEDLVNERAEYDIRQYDLMTNAAPMRVSSDKEANVFTAEATTNIREIGVQHADDQTTITYEIYLLDDDAVDPTDGVLLTSGSEYYEYSGYHRIKTDKVCIIPEGFRYSVVVTQEKEGEDYISVFLNFNEQSVLDREASGEQGIRKYAKAVVNRGESYVLYNGDWIDWVDFIPSIQYSVAQGNPGIEEDWLDIDNFSIKVYADFITDDLRAEATQIGSNDAAASVGVFDKTDAETQALISLVQVYNDISNNITAENAFTVENGYISAEDYNHIAQLLIDPNRNAGLKVVVVTKEISASDIDEIGLKKLLAAANENIALYADISLIVQASDTGEYLGSLHKTDEPIQLAIAVPADLAASGNPVYVLRLHNGVVERLETTVEDGYAYFSSDLFSTFALAYDVNEVAVDNDDNVDNVDNVTPPDTGDASNTVLWLVLMGLSVAVALTAVLIFKKKRED